MFFTPFKRNDLIFHRFYTSSTRYDIVEKSFHHCIVTRFDRFVWKRWSTKSDNWITWNEISWVLFGFKIKSLFWNNLKISLKAISTLLVSLSGDKIIDLTAVKNNSLFIELYAKQSFTEIIKKIGPSQLPCGASIIYLIKLHNVL